LRSIGLGIFVLGCAACAFAATEPATNPPASEAASTQAVLIDPQAANVCSKGPAEAGTTNAAGPSNSASLRSNSRPIIGQPADTFLDRNTLKRFDFDERQFGNVEEIPMYWLRRKGPNLPHYNRGAFDREIGHDAAPSFRLDTITESVAFTYTRNDIAVEPGNRYSVSGWIRTHNLRKSRARLSVAYLARDLSVIEQTEVFSEAIGEPDQNDQWLPIDLQTPEAPRSARFLQITAWLAQPAAPQADEENARPIQQQDTHGTAWFDDIEVKHLLPVASIRTLDDIPTFAAAEPVQLLGPRVNPAHFGLACRIDVTDEDGTSYYRTQTDPEHLGEAPPAAIRLDNLPCGLYTATLDVFSKDRRITRQQVRFAKLPGLTQRVNSQIGVCLDESSLRAPLATMTCLRGMQAGLVKIPIWTSRLTDTQIAHGEPGAAELLRRVLAEGLEPVGVFVAAPASIAANLLPSQRNLVDLFAADRRIWQPYMALSLTHYADVVRLWQIGQDGQADLALDDRYSTAADAAAQQIVTLIDGAQVALAWPAAIANPNPARSIKRESLSVPSAVRPEWIGQYLKAHTRDGRPMWVTVWPIEGERYAPHVRRADLARRIVHTLAEQVETVFVPQPWRSEQVGHQTILAPTIEYTVLATLSRVLSGRRYAGCFEWTGGAVFHIFTSQDDATLVAWNDQVPDRSSREAKVDLYLGQKVAGFDLRGRPVHVEGTETQTISIGQEPIVITGVDARLAELRSRFTIVPRQVASGMRRHVQTVTLVNPYGEPMNGTIRLRGPQGWDLTPSRLTFSLQPGKTMQGKVEIHIPYNEPIGSKTIQADLSVDTRRMHQISIPVTLDLQLPGVETYAFCDATPDEVVIRHVLTNRTEEELSFVGSVLLPTAARQERLFLHVRPGQTMVKEYVIPRPEVAGQSQLRLSLREINGSRLLNQMVEIF
jgi:hypothetical protein